jgi:tight adherence protein B
MKIRDLAAPKLFVIVLVSIFIFVFALLISDSSYIAISFTCFLAILAFVARKKVSSRKALLIQSSAPEMIDHLRAGIQSGLSLNESLIGLSVRGPEVFRSTFLRFRDEIYATGNFDHAIARAKTELAHPSTDQILESLAMAKVLGSAELLNILRLLGKFIREDLSLRREIAVKHNWIKNSAHLSAAAPWLLLLLLSTQPSTSRAFSTQSGALVLTAGLAMTAIAYIWMSHLAKLPQTSRVFAETHIGLTR